jgi:SNF2 family DNA or RNA helicase
VSRRVCILIEVRVLKSRIYVKAPFEIKDILKNIPTARWESRHRMWSFAATPSAAQKLDALSPDITDDKFRDLLDQSFNIGSAEIFKNQDDLPQPECRKNDSWKHQLAAYWFANNLQAAMFYMGMGTGKSKVTVDLIINKGYQRVLIVCPKSVLTVWPKEFKKHAGHDRYAVMPLTKGSVMMRTEAAEFFMKLQNTKGNQAIVVANYEMVWRPPFDSFAINFAKFDLVVCDESHKIKAPGSKVSMYFSKLADKVPNRLCLTGTPMPNGPLDAYGQYRFLDKGIFGTSYALFRTHYAQTVPVNGGHMVVGYINQDELHDKFYSIAYRADRDVLDLPPAIHQTREVELSPKTQKIYDQLEKDFYAWVEFENRQGHEVSISNALTKLLRLQQICSGFVPSDDGTTIQTGTEKLDALKDYLDDLEPREPVVVFCRFRLDLEAVHEAAKKTGRTSSELSGSNNQLQEWQDGKTDILAVQLQAGGVGIDLTRACYCVYYSVGFSLGDYEQSLARVHRPGQDRTTFYMHIVAVDTVDEKVQEALDKKKKIIESILDREG